MNRIEALEIIKETWNADCSLKDKIIIISTNFYASGLDLASTAAYIKATPIELDLLLSLSELNDDIIDLLSEVNPPKTTWTMLVSANEKEIYEALRALQKNEKKSDKNNSNYTFSEFVYQKMLEVSGPTVEQKVSKITGKDLLYLHKKATDYGVLNTWQSNFLRSVANQKKMGKVLSEKQITNLIKILKELIDKNVIKKDSIDGDQEICDMIMEALK